MLGTHKVAIEAVVRGVWFKLFEKISRKRKKFVESVIRICSHCYIFLKNLLKIYIAGQVDKWKHFKETKAQPTQN